MSKIGRIIMLVGVFAVMVSLSLVRDGRLFGHAFEREKEVAHPAISVVDGTTVVNTSEVEGLPTGYAGAVPVKAYITGNRIDSIRPLPNAESPRFFGRLSEEGLTRTWDGKTLSEAAGITPDAVSGATFSSKAYIANAHAAIDIALEAQGRTAADDSSDAASRWLPAGIAAILVIIMGAVIPLFVHNKTYRIIQQLLNVAVLGFWTGTFLDYAVMIGFFANGFTFSAASTAILLMLAVAYIYPLFGKNSHYCMWVCPLGAAQDLAGHLSRRKIHIGVKTVHALDIFRKVLWVVLLSMLWLGWLSEWIDYEIFTAFAIKSAGWGILVAGGVIIILSVFIPRPYCRFVCPTGTILRAHQDAVN